MRELHGDRPAGSASSEMSSTRTRLGDKGETLRLEHVEQFADIDISPGFSHFALLKSLLSMINELTSAALSIISIKLSLTKSLKST